MIADLKPHASYERSDHDWLGAIPAHWRLLRAKYAFREVDERSSTGKEELLSVSHLTGVTPRRLKNVTMFMAESNVGHKICQPNDLVINTLWAWMSALGVSRHTGIVSPAYGVYRPIAGSDVLSTYADLLLRTPLYAAEYQRRSTGVNSSRLRLYPEQFLRIPLLVPPLEEQAAIVRFLDWSNGRLERTIRAKRKVIALLNEQKQAVIHRAVTRGLDTSAPLKPSGNPWFGEIPNHWTAVRFKTKVGIQEGPGIMLADFRLSGVPLLRISCLAGEEANLAGCNFLSPSMVREKWSHFAVQPGDYLLSASGSTGAVRKASSAVVGAIPYTGIIRLWPKSNDVVMEYLRLSMSASPFADQIAAAKSGVGIEHFGPTHLKRMWICLPPAPEQIDILAALAQQTSGLDSALHRLKSEIDLLREYQTRLTADVVTGQLDVRDAASRLPDDVSSELHNDDADLTDDAEDIAQAEEEEAIE